MRLATTPLKPCSSRAGVALTSDGARLLPLAKGLCDQYRRLQTEVDDLHGIQSGLIRIGVFSSAADASPAVRRFLSYLPCRDRPQIPSCAFRPSLL